DFGLAKPSAAPASARPLSAVQTVVSLTAEHSVVGTLGYMAPEQLAGTDAGARTDIFALGAVLYEMATGRRAFSGDSQAAVIGAVLRDRPPPIETLVPGCPPALDRLVDACLAKDPEQRWESAADLATELRWIAAGAEPAARAKGAAAMPGRRERLAWAIAALTGAAAVLVPLARRTPAPAEPTRFTIAAPAGQIFFSSVAL